MKNSTLILFIFGFFFLSCSEKKEPLGINAHPGEWLKNHGKVIVQDSSMTLRSCQTCHGVNYEGGSSNVSCIKCHNYPHVDSWNQKSSDQFHGKIAKQSESESCQPCHGERFDGGSSNVSCFDCHTYPHLDSWSQTESQEFHGQIMLMVGKVACQSCHGIDYSGGSSEVSCFDCHTYPHQDGFAQPGNENFHEQYLRVEINWNLSSCRTCHGTDYSGGRADYSCLTCHQAAGGPEACNTCHGSLENFAPPLDLNNNSEIMAVGVGAHQAHVNELTVTDTYDCAVCHTPVANFEDQNHIDSSPHAEVVFDAFSTQNGTLASSWNRNNSTCSEIYCHGNFVFKRSESENVWGYADSLITGNSEPVNWVQTPAEEKCDFCHGIPPTGHIDFGMTVQSCVVCHTTVVDADGNIIDKTKHINGQADLN